MAAEPEPRTDIQEVTLDDTPTAEDEQGALEQVEDGVKADVSTLLDAAASAATSEDRLAALEAADRH